MANDTREFHKIEDIKRKLYEPDFSSHDHHKEGVLHPVKYDVPESWSQESKDPTIMKKRKSSSFFKKFFIGAMLFFVISVGVAYFLYNYGGGVVSNENIEITVLGNAFAQGGEELPIQIEIVNKNNAALELANLIIEYPRGASVVSKEEDLIRLPRESLGTIPAGGRAERSKKVTLYGDQGTLRNVTVRLEYHPEGSNAIFVKSKEYPVTISSSPVSLLFDGPNSTSSNQEVTFKVTANLHTTLPSDQALLKVEYPLGFKFTSAVPAPFSGNSVWKLSDLTTTKPFEVSIKGTLMGQDGDEQAFHAYVGTVPPENPSKMDVIYTSILHTVAIEKPYLQARIVINGESKDEYAVNGGAPLRVEILWSNNLTTPVLDGQIVAKLSGNVFDKNSVSVSEGFFDSSTNQITWDRNTSSEFSFIDPGATGSVNFTLTPLSVFGSNSSLKDPQMNIDIGIKGREQGGNIDNSPINSSQKVNLRVVSNFQIANSAVYLSGSRPPKAETETVYTINWILSNSANLVTGAEARALLPVYVKWVAQVGGNNENLSYDANTREVVWKIGTVRPNTGFGTINREVSFNIALKPSVSQVNSTPQIIKDVALTGQDAFANVLLKSSKGPLSTRTDSDPTFKPGDAVVIK